MHLRNDFAVTEGYSGQLNNSVAAVNENIANLHSRFMAMKAEWLDAGGDAAVELENRFKNFYDLASQMQAGEARGVQQYNAEAASAVQRGAARLSSIA